MQMFISHFVLRRQLTEFFFSKNILQMKSGQMIMILQRPQVFCRFPEGALAVHSYFFGVQPRELKKKLTDNLFLTAPRIWKPNNGSFYHSYQYVVEIRICGGRDPLFSFPDLVWSCLFLALTSFDLTKFFFEIEKFCRTLLSPAW